MNVKSLISTVLITVSLTGCVLFVNSAQSAKSRTVVITHKKQAVDNITAFHLDFSNLKLSKEDAQKEKSLLREEIRSALEKNDLYHPDEQGDKIKIIVKRVNDNFSDRSFEAFIIITNANNEALSSAVIIERGKALRSLDRLRENFAQKLVDYIKLPPES